MRRFSHQSLYCWIRTIPAFSGQQIENGQGEKPTCRVCNSAKRRRLEFDMIVIVDYGMGNLRSVEKGFERFGFDVKVTDDPTEVKNADKLVLPGVGAFRDAMDGLRQRGLLGPIVDYIQSGKPFLGICLGLQLLFSKGYEDGEHDGLGIIPGKVIRFKFSENG